MLLQLVQLVWIWVLLYLAYQGSCVLESLQDLAVKEVLGFVDFVDHLLGPGLHMNVLLIKVDHL